MAHILVTGANGFIGSHLVRLLLERKEREGWSEDILCLVRGTSDLSSLKGLPVKLVIGDFRDPESLEPAVRGATYIYHLGAQLYTISRKRFLDANAVGTENLLKAAVTHAKDSLKRFLLVSSLAAAGPAKGLEPLTEKDKPGPPVSWYAESKQEAEKIAHGYMSVLPVTIVRPSGVYGPRDPAFASAFNAARMRIRPVIGFKKRYAGMVYAPDLVEGMVAAATHPDAVGETYFLSNPVNYSVNEIGKTFGKAVGKPFGITLPVPLFMMRLTAIFTQLFSHFTRNKPMPTRDKVRDLSQVYWLCSAEKAREQIGWEAKTTLLDGATATHQYMKAEEKEFKEMPGESKSILGLKYFCIGVVLGLVIEVLAAFGKVYAFHPWHFMIGVVIGLWGIVFGGLAMKTRRSGFPLQFILGFIILFGAELLNHYYLHNWSFYTGDIFGLASMTPLARAAWLGFATGFIIPLLNGIMGQLYRRQLRVG
ncbi:MAG: NAD-dependent epimerase/dehydratase family protein [bacterium]|nr:NAD-dependent epimerase/dehydratase family protein [bacterium]